MCLWWFLIILRTESNRPVTHLVAVGKVSGSGKKAGVNQFELRTEKKKVLDVFSILVTSHVCSGSVASLLSLGPWTQFKGHSPQGAADLCVGCKRRDGCLLTLLSKHIFSPNIFFFAIKCIIVCSLTAKTSRLFRLFHFSFVSKRRRRCWRTRCYRLYLLLFQHLFVVFSDIYCSRTPLPPPPHYSNINCSPASCSQLCLLTFPC